VNLAGNSIGLTKSGSALAVLSGVNSYTGRTTVAGGMLELGSAAQNCVLNLGGADVQSGAIVFDYSPGADPAATIRSLLRASCDGGRWDVGQFRDSTATTSGLTLGCFDNTVTDQVKVMATYPGDFNLDGVVDNQDKAIWLAHAFTGTTWQQGDANYDGRVDGLDRDIWCAHVGLPPIAVLSPAGVAPVPEPGTLALLAAGLLGLLAYGWRKRK
jgi:autotransporter-associated beta strand protein